MVSGIHKRPRAGQSPALYCQPQIKLGALQRPLGLVFGESTLESYYRKP